MAFNWKNNTFLVVSALLITLFLSSSSTSSQRMLQSYTTTPTRTSTVTTLCAGKNRTTLVNSAEISTNAQYSAQMKSSIGIDGNTLMTTLLVQKNQTGAISMVQSNATGLGIFVGVFILGFIILMIIWQCLCCCCCCPSCCPSKCCQKAEDEQYTKCQLYWPSITLILALLLSISASAYGFSQATAVYNGVSNMACSIAILTDDILNGNTTDDGTSYFLGMNTLSTQLGYISGNMSTINNSLTQLTNTAGTNMSNILTQATTAMNDVDLVPTGVAGGTMPAFNYMTPFTSAAAATPIASTFPTALGTTASGGSGLVGVMYTGIDAAKGVLNGIAVAAGGFVNNSATFNSSISGAQGTLNSFTNIVVNGDKAIGGYLSMTSQSSMATMVVEIFYGVIIGFSLLALLGVLLMTFCDKYKCRHLMYFSCIFLFFIGIVGFLLSSLFSIIVPVLYLGCGFITTSFSSSANFTANFGTFITDTTTMNYLTTCLASSSGDIVSQISGIGQLTNLSTAFSSITNYNVSAASAPLQTGVTSFINTIANYGNGAMSDITDTSSINILSTIASRSGYGACVAPTFAGDSWIPSVNVNQTYVSCVGGFANQGTSTSCSGVFAAGTGSCNGCMDTFDLLFGSGTAVGATATLQTRYSIANSCTSFTTDLGNIWFNFFKPKQTLIGAPQQAGYSNALTGSGLYSRAKAAQGSIDTFIGYINTNISTLFTNTLTATSSLSSILNPTYGVIAGLNCRLLGQDFNRITNTMCVSLFNTLYISRLIIGIASYGILFALCCITCSGVRHYKHSQRKDKVKDEFFNNNSFDQGTKLHMNAKGY